MNNTILWFFAFGFVFGLATYSKRHVFSEGPSARPAADEGYALGGRLVWALVCSGLWPILMLTGAYSLRRMARARADSHRDERR